MRGKRGSAGWRKVRNPTIFIKSECMVYESTSRYDLGKWKKE